MYTFPISKKFSQDMLHLVVLTIASVSYVSLGAFSPTGASTLRISPNSAFRVVGRAGMTPTTSEVGPVVRDTPIEFSRGIAEDAIRPGILHPSSWTNFAVSGVGFPQGASEAAVLGLISSVPFQNQGQMVAANPLSATTPPPSGHLTWVSAFASSLDSEGPSNNKRRRVMGHPDDSV